MKTIIVAASSFVTIALALAGCAADATSSDVGSSAAAVSGAPVAQEFQHCGGFIADAPVCATGLKCELGPVPDAGGTCVKSGVGAHCGGFIANPPKCEAGLQCVLNVSSPDTGGTCDYATYGEACGGFIASAVECGAGLACSHVDASGNRINPDLPGVCLEGAGQPCGGNMTTAKACAAGLTCEGGKLVGDIGGTCQ